jgi:CO/xanthine dehydrogenase Mo-binding subunit
VREVNVLRVGDTLPTGQRIGRDCSARRVLREAVKRTAFRQKRRAYAGTNRGIGLSLVFHGSGFTGSGEVRLASKASLELTPRGVRVLVASAEIGQGARTVHAQIVADTLGVPYDAVEIAQPDTARVPDSGPTVASRTSMVVGRLLERCAKDMRGQLGRLAPSEYLRVRGPLVVTKEYVPPPGIKWDDERYCGDAYGTYAWACNVAEIEIDPVTYEARLFGVTAVQEVGRVLHPVLAAGQIEGGTVQAIGYALLEEVVMRDGRMANAQMTNYVIPTAVDTPPIDVVFLERPYRYGPYGAKGIGELPMDGPAPAIVNAIRQTGIAIEALPATPERILEAIERGRVRPGWAL